MAWREGPPEDAGLHAGEEDDIGAEEGPAERGRPPADLLAEVNAVAQHLRELQKRLGSYRRREDEGGPERERRVSEPPPPPNGVGQADDASEHVAAIIAAAETAANEIRARAEATAAEIVANAESAAVRIRDEARSEERRLFEAIDALRPAAAEFQHALERVHDAAVAALMSYPRS